MTEQEFEATKVGQIMRCDISPNTVFVIITYIEEVLRDEGHHRLCIVLTSDYQSYRVGDSWRAAYSGIYTVVE